MHYGHVNHVSCATPKLQDTRDMKAVVGEEAAFIVSTGPNFFKMDWLNQPLSSEKKNNQLVTKLWLYDGKK